jgi:hypothetical protein
MIEQQEYPIPVTIENKGEAGTTGALVLYLDGEEVWRTANDTVFPSGPTMVHARLTADAGIHNLVFLLEEMAHDDIESDDWIEVNVTVVPRPDLMFDSITNPPENMLQDGRELVIGVAISNQGGTLANGTLKVYDNGQIFFETEVSINSGNLTTISVPWTATKGHHELEFELVDVEPWEAEVGNNKASLFLEITKKPEEKGTNWPLLSLMVVGVLAPFVALVIYYSQVQPVRDMEALRRKQAVGGKKGRKRKVLRSPKGKKARPKKVKKVKEQKDDGEGDSEE